MDVKLKKVARNGAVSWQPGYAVNYCLGRMKVITADGNVLLDSSIQFFNGEVDKGRIMKE